MEEELRRLFAPVHDRAIVTGAGSGIGRAVALSLAGLGVKVYVMGRTRSKLEETARQGAGRSGQIVPITYDMTKPDIVAAAFDQIARDGGPPQAIVHAAADALPCLAEDITVELFRGTVASVLEGTFNTVQTWAKALIEAKLPGVAVCYTSSTSSRETPGLSHSSAAKNGVQSMIRSWAREWGRFGIRLSMLGPGLFPEPDMHHTESLAVEKTRARLLQRIALGRAGELHEIVGPAIWLLSRSGTYMTGEGFSVDGGIHLLDWTRAPAD